MRFGGIGFAFTPVIFFLRLPAQPIRRSATPAYLAWRRSAKEVISADLPLSRPLLSRESITIDGSRNLSAAMQTDDRLDSFCLAAPAPAHGASGYICNPRILSSFPAVSRAGQVCTRKRNGLHSRPTARLYLLQRADYTCKKSCERRRAQIPRYRLITEGVATTRKPTRKPKCVFRTQSKFSKC